MRCRDIATLLSSLSVLLWRAEPAVSSFAINGGNAGTTIRPLHLLDILLVGGRPNWSTCTRAPMTEDDWQTRTLGREEPQKTMWRIFFLPPPSSTVIKCWARGHHTRPSTLHYLIHNSLWFFLVVLLWGLFEEERPDIYLFRVGTKSIEINDLTQFWIYFFFSLLESRHCPGLFYIERDWGKGRSASKGRDKRC